MSDVEQGSGTATAAVEPPSTVGRVFHFVTDHPKTSLLVGAGLSAAVGAELIAAALLGGAITLVLKRNRDKGA